MLSTTTEQLGAGNHTCDVSLSELEFVPATLPLGAGNHTCDVSLSELELVPAVVVRGYPDLASEVDWISPDRGFLSAFVGTCVLILGSLVMVLASLHGAAGQKNGVGLQASVAPIAVVDHSTENHAAVTPEPNTQDSLLKRPAPRAQRKVRRLAAKAPVTLARPLRSVAGRTRPAGRVRR